MSRRTRSSPFAPDSYANETRSSSTASAPSGSARRGIGQPRLGAQQLGDAAHARDGALHVLELAPQLLDRPAEHVGVVEEQVDRASVITPRLQRYAPMPNETVFPTAKMSTVIDQSTVRRRPPSDVT